MHDLSYLRKINGSPKARETRHAPTAGLCHGTGASAEYLSAKAKLDDGACLMKRARQLDARDALVKAALTLYETLGNRGTPEPLLTAVRAYREAHGG